jgi:CBS domain containing-hemolysin-like protein
MGIEIGITCLLLVALTFLATVDMAFGQLSDVGLRLLIAEAEEQPAARSTPFLKEILENRPRFRFTISAAVQIMLVAVSVLITAIALRAFSLESFSQTRLILAALVAGLTLAFIFRQLIPRLITLRNPESCSFRCRWCVPFIACCRSPQTRCTGSLTACGASVPPRRTARTRKRKTTAATFRR